MRGLPCGSRMHLHAIGSTAQRFGRVGASEVAWKPPSGRQDNTHFLSTMADPHDSETVPDTLTVHGAPGWRLGLPSQLIKD